jgi:hypothetical protein
VVVLTGWWRDNRLQDIARRDGSAGRQLTIVKGRPGVLMTMRGSAART